LSAAFDIDCEVVLERMGESKANTKINVNGGGQECPPHT
jgi:hypothetical protein